MIGQEEHESVLETLSILNDAATMSALAEADRELAAGDLIPLD